MGFGRRKKVTPRYHMPDEWMGRYGRYSGAADASSAAGRGVRRSKEDIPQNNERPETFSSPGRPGSPPPELLTEQIKRVAESCLWHSRAILTQKVPCSHPPENQIDLSKLAFCRPEVPVDFADGH